MNELLRSIQFNKPVNAEQYKSRPPASIITLGPDISISINSAGDQSVCLGCPVDACHSKVMLIEDVLKSPLEVNTLVDVHLVVVRGNRQP
jgi:hypothetical protein